MEIKSLNRGLQIIELFSYERPVLSFDEISPHCPFPKSTLYRFLENLTRRGFLKVNSATRKYHLGPVLIRLGQIAEKGVPLMEACQPAMRRLSQEIGESVYLSVRDGDQKVCLSCVEARGKPIKYAPTPASVAPLHAGASGKVLLAFLPEQEMVRLVDEATLTSVTPKTITDRDELKLRLSQVRKKGYDYSEGELVPGTWALAFPILDPKGSAFASLTVAGILLNSARPGLKKLVERVKKEMSQIEHELWDTEGPESTTSLLVLEAGGARRKRGIKKQAQC